MRTNREVSQAVGEAAKRGDNAVLLALADEAQLLGNDDGDCLMHVARGIVAANRSEHEQALAHYAQALELSERLKDHLRSSTILNNMGNVNKNVGRHEEAFDQYARALDIAEREGSREFAAMALGNIGILHAVSGDFPKAQEFMMRGPAIEEELGDTVSAASTIGNLGVVSYNAGDYPTAIERYQRAFDMAERAGVVRSMAINLGNIGNCYVGLGDHTLALEYFHRALVLHEQVENRASIARVNGNIAVALRSLDDHEGALRHLEVAAAMDKEMGNVHEFIFATCTLVDTLVELGRGAEARAALDRIADLQNRDPRTQSHVVRVRGRILELEGDLDGALRQYETALVMMEEIGNRLMQAELHKELRDLARKRNDFEGYIAHNDLHIRLTEEVKGKEATQKVAMMQSEKKLTAERQEKERHRALLYNTLPPTVAERVMRGETVNDAIDLAAVLFMDMVGFTSMSASMAPDDVVKLLGEIFTTCDRVVSAHDVMKIKTIGDSYMAVGINAEGADSPVLRTAQAAGQLRTVVSENFPDIRIRIGLHCGPVTAGVIGTDRLQYDVWGDTVNVASRMESTGEPGRIHVSEAYATRLAEDMASWDTLTLRGEIDVKGKGTMTTYWLDPQ